MLLSDAKGIARQIGQHSVGAAEGALAVDHPFDPARRRQIFREDIAVRKVGVPAKGLSALACVGCGDREDRPCATYFR